MEKICFLFLFTSCTTFPMTGSEDQSQQFVRAAMPFTLEGVAYTGTAVVQRKTSQKLELVIPDNSVRLLIRTCHREEVFDNPKAGKFTYMYAPATFLENWGECRLRVQVVDGKANIQQLMVEFTSNETLQGRSQCNGKPFVDGTVSFCQSREGLIQRISFTEKVASAEGTGCPLLKGDGLAFEYAVGKGSCIYAFRSEKTGSFHRLVTYGYNSL